MNCFKCPHHVRHGFAGENNTIQFDDFCGLKIKEHNRENQIGIETKPPGRKPVKVSDKKVEPRQFAKPKPYSPKLKCDQIPFPDDFEYVACSVYRDTFKSGTERKDVVPTKDFEFTDMMPGNSGSFVDMELL